MLSNVSISDDDTQVADRRVVVLSEIVYRNPLVSNRDAYIMDLALWGLNHIEDKPNPADYELSDVSYDESTQYLLELVDLMT